jgi:ribosome biogenesis GTPase YqeH
MTDSLSDPLGTCTGCGVALQSREPELLGYVPVGTADVRPVVCQRCYRIRNYNETSSITMDQEQFRRLLGSIAHRQALVVNIVDIFDFDGSLINGLQRYVGQNTIVLVVNKIDLLPKVSNWNKIVNWVQRQAKEHGLRVAEIVLCSAKKNIGFDRVVHAIAAHRQGRDIYVVGATNVGKSTLINRLIRDFSDLQSELTTSQYPGTTLDLVKIPLDDGKQIIDTPGIVYTHRLTEIAPKSDLKKLIPDRQLKPMVYQLNDKQTLFFGGYARFDFVSGARQSFTCYLSQAIPIHRTKLERADELYEEHAGEMLAPPVKSELDALPHWVKHHFHIPKGADDDVLISGIGWVHMNGKAGAHIVVHAPKGVKVAMRRALI